jgi:hypothetical protein
VRIVRPATGSSAVSMLSRLMTLEVDVMKKDRNSPFTELLVGAQRLQRRNRRARRIGGVVGTALRMAAAISLFRKLGPRRTGRLIAFAASSELNRARNS